MLAAVALTDEFWSGVAVVAAPEVEREHGVEHRGYALLVFALPLLGGALIEAAIAVFVDRYRRRPVARLASFVTAAALVLCALADGGALLALGLMLSGTASGIACSAAKGELVSVSNAAANVARPGTPDGPSVPAGGAPAARALARWALLGAIGDVLTPLFVAFILGAGESYRVAFSAAAALAALQGLLIAGGSDEPHANARHAAVATPLEPDDDLDDKPEPLLVALREGARQRQLWLWLLGAGLCTFLDEIVIALAALYAERDLGAPAATAVACATAASGGAVLGAWITERVLGSVDPDRVLLASGAGTLGALLAVLCAPSVAWLALALFVLGAMSVPEFALLEAKAYAAIPGRPGVVHALAQVFVAIDIGGPLVLGAIADAFGLSAALACLAVQPLGVLLVMLRASRRPRSNDAAPEARGSAPE